jgi:hypothetical protein
MFWIKNHKGGLVNLARATDVRIVDVNETDEGRNVYKVRVYFDGPGDAPGITDLFKGTKDECYAWLDALVSELSGYYGDHGPAFHDVKVPEPPKPGDPDVPF